MSRIVALNALTAGISRLRTKGGADPQSLFDLENGYVTLAGTIQSRPGTEQDAALPTGTKGLCAFDGGLVVFSHVAQTVPAGYSCEVIIHPTLPDLPLHTIHYAGPFLGVLYVCVEFANGDVFDYWLQRRDAWAANTAYMIGDVVEPTTRNGYAYRAKRLGAAGTAWAPNIARTVGDVVEPTEFSGFKHTVTDTLGSNPRSGALEPDWAEADGGVTLEDTDLTPPATPTTPTDPGATLPPDIEDRYGGGLGNGFGGRNSGLTL